MSLRVEDAGHPAEENPRPPKRRKTLLACNDCRNKKIKCDGLRPVCGACMNKKASRRNCIYDDVQTKDSSSSRRLVDQLYRRIRELEQQQQGQANNTYLQSPSSTAVETQSHHEGDQAAFSHSPNKESMPWDSLPASHVRSSNTEIRASVQLQSRAQETSPVPLVRRLSIDPDSSNRQASIDGVSAIVGAVTGEPQDEGFHGSSSAAVFLRQIRNAIASKAGENPTTDQLSDSLEPSGSALHRTHRKETQLSYDYVLPSRKLADSLVRTYWNFVYPTHPYVNRRQFKKIYDRIWLGDASDGNASLEVDSSSSPDESVSLCIFNLVLALACQFSNVIEREDSRSTGQVFFNRAKALVNFDPVDTGNRSIHLIQAFLLMGEYLHSTSAFNQAWVVIGIAIRMCHEIGLHRFFSEDRRNPSNLLEREMAKRIYHGCLVIESIICMHLGRPLMISRSSIQNVALPLEIDDDLLEQQEISAPALSGQQTSHPVSVLTFFVLSTKMFRIVQKILEGFYTDSEPPRSRGFDRFFIGPESVFQIDRELKELYKSIPKFLIIGSATSLGSSSDERAPVFHRQAIILKIRFLHAQLYLFRPILSEFIYTSTQNSPQKDEQMNFTNNVTNVSPGVTLFNRTALQCSVICTNIAIDLIDIVYNQLTVHDSWSQKPRWWFSVLHVYLSATVLIAARLQPEITSGVPEREFDTAWDHALQILRFCQSHDESALRCVAALEILYAKLPKKSHTNESSDPVLAQNRINESGVEDLQGQVGVDGSMYYPSISQQFEDDSMAFLDLTDMSWFDIFPPAVM